MGEAISGRATESIYLQAAAYPRSYRARERLPIVRVTAKEFVRTYILPYTSEDGSEIYLGDDESGYPPQLYPNLSYAGGADTTVVSYDGKVMSLNTTLLLGPYYINTNFSLISMTISINDNTSGTEILGWLTIVVNAQNIRDIINARAGMGHTGEIAIVGPATTDNHFIDPLKDQTEGQISNLGVQIKATSSNDHRRKLNDTSYASFLIGQYPAVLKTWSSNTGTLNNAGSMIHSTDETGHAISVGYSQVDSDIVDWMLVFTQTRNEVQKPLHSLRNTILECVFPVVAAVCLICIIIAHYAVQPIWSLKVAAANSIATYETWESSEQLDFNQKESHLGPRAQVIRHLRFMTSQRRPSSARRRRMFQIPAKVPERRHFVQDELTELTVTFNEMVDELVIQYEKLENRVQSRTAELEQSRNEAQAANESKTLFIANVSHELRTPLNGVIGMCAVAMQEEDISRVRQSLDIIYKSSDLLLHLLNDLLTFSRSSYGQQLAIEDETFRLEDVGIQLVSLFEKQARDAHVSLKVIFIGASHGDDVEISNDVEDSIFVDSDNLDSLRQARPRYLARGPADTGTIREMGLRGDKNRIVQILMNLVGNSLKFTAAQGQIEVRMRCLGIVPLQAAESNSDSRTLLDVPAQQENMKSESCSQKSKWSHSSNVCGERQLELTFEFEVEDTGAGIPEHMLDEIFKPFVQADLTLSKTHGGTGLGLAICSQLAKMMNGEIKVKSTVGIGSTFTLSLPLKYTKEKVPSISDSLARSARRTSLASSIHFDTFSTKSDLSRKPRNRPRSMAENSHLHENKPTGLDNPRVVGYSQPFVVHDNKSTDSFVRASEKQRYNRLDTIQSVSTPVHPTMSQDPAIDDSSARRITKMSQDHNLRSVVTQPSEVSVLVAEDNHVNQQVILRLLKLEKIANVTLAENGEEALAAVQESLSRRDGPRFSLVLMDIQMPKMDGIECTKRLRALSFASPIIALTAFDHETNRENCKAAGMDDFLPKPIRRTALRTVLETYGAGRRP